MSYLDQRREHINAGRPLPEKKKPKWLKPVSDKLAAKRAAAKEVRGEDDTEKEKWFRARRKEMVGVCQCGCGQRSSKSSDDDFYASVAHIFPQRLFPSIQLHRLNWVERNFWHGCHHSMDNKSMDLWPNMADWEDIKAKFHVLAPKLTDKERARKFYTKLAELVEKN